MACVLQALLKKTCSERGLKLEVCPQGDNSEDVGGKTINAYSSAESLFDALELIEPTLLADTLVILDVGTELKNAFEPVASTDGGWHVIQNQDQRRAGVAVELLLRFPQVFPVILSPAVPVGLDKELADWKAYKTLEEELSCLNKTSEKSSEAAAANGEDCPTNSISATKNGPSRTCDVRSLFTQTTFLHFVSPLAACEKPFDLVLSRFANGMRCWFDPTGLRTLVKNRFIGSLFGEHDHWKNTSDQRDVLKKRLSQVCVAVDEERDFALLNAYAAWKFGRRTWVVTTYGEFNFDKDRLVGERSGTDVLVLRDVDIRFPDVPDRPKTSEKSEVSDKLEKDGIRKQLKDIFSEEWEPKIDASWHVRAVSSDAHVECYQRKGQKKEQNNKPIEYFGFRKPMGSLYELRSALGVQARAADGSILSHISAVDDKEKSNQGGHGAPYLNLAMAEALLRNSARCRESPSAHLLGALLAMEAYELLLGMSKTTALAALLLLHKHEVAAEVSFPGISHALDINDRKHDIEKTLDSLYGKKRTSDDKRIQRMYLIQFWAEMRIKRMYLSQFWAEMRIKYREGEQFSAAEEANLQSLLNMNWTPKFLRELHWSQDRRVIDHVINPIKPLYGSFRERPLWYWIKLSILRTTNSFSAWLIASSVLILAVAFLYSCIRGSLSFTLDFHLLRDVVLSSITIQPYGVVDTIVKEDGWGAMVGIIHFGLGYVLFGVLISMLYRKITRS